MGLQKASVFTFTNRAPVRLRFHLYNRVPASFGFTSTIGLQEASVSPLQYGPGKLRFHLYNRAPKKLRFHLYNRAPGSFGVTSTIWPQEASVSPLQ